MNSLFTIHCVDQDKLTEVIHKMRGLGAPRIRVVDCVDFYIALEGTHQMAAAEVLGVAPILDVLEQDDLVDSSTLDWDFLFGGVMCRAGELTDEVLSPLNESYRINQDGTVSRRDIAAAISAR
ncbi:hypothetical protein [Pseudomonas sp. NPDC089569]|uniref:hypothetical protein n=1 Tax=Pseudomonas sp. NPDC089569 TaxID=3390722 RepID=UPI003D076405